MLKSQVVLNKSHTLQTLFPFHHHLISGAGAGAGAFAFSPYRLTPASQKNTRIISRLPSTIGAVVTSDEKSTRVKAVVTVKVPVGGFLSNLGLSHGIDDIKDLFGKSILLELVSAEVDPKTGLEKGTISGYAHKIGEDKDEVKYECDFVVGEDFGEIGAIVVENEHHREMYLKTISLDGLPNGIVNVNCNSWVAPKSNNQGKRVFFTNKSYLPSQTSNGLRWFREKELEEIRGNGQGERKTSDRIYDYDVYNDLGDPDSKLELKRPVLGGKELKRPVLGGKEHPYPRRCRTGRPRCKKDPMSETRSSSVYVPRDEAFSDVKNQAFAAKAVYSVLHAIVPSLETAIVDTNLPFPYFTAIDSLFNEGVNIPPLPQNGFLKSLLPRIVKFVSDTSDNLLRFETPEMFERMAIEE